MTHATGPFDVVVVGSGVAGLTVALGLSGLRVAVVTRGLSGLRVAVVTRGPSGLSGSTPLAQGGIAAAVATGDTPAAHARDTLAAAAGLADPGAVAILTQEAPAAIARILSLGVRLDHDSAGRLAVHREAAHSCGRVVHARDATGRELARGLAEALRAQPGVTLFEQTFATDVVLAQGRVCGLRARDAAGHELLLECRAAVLATGGIGRLWARTTNPPESTGDGLALAARAGARLTDLEFMQFHPTALHDSLDPLPLLTEALRGAGAVIVDEEGRRFLTDVDPAAELGPRDIVARGLARHILGGHRALLDARGIGLSFPDAFPTVFEICAKAGLDPRHEPVPISPAAHYHMGGVAVDGLGRTSVPGLFACGEVSCTGVHGANRLASNSLLEGLVFGHRLALGLRTALAAGELPRTHFDSSASAPSDSHSAEAESIVTAIRDEMWARVGLLRDGTGLARARQEIARAASALPPGATEARNIALVADLVAAAAQARTESRGAHHRTDHPTPAPQWQGRHLTIPGTDASGLKDAITTGDSQ